MNNHFQLISKGLPSWFPGLMLRWPLPLRCTPEEQPVERLLTTRTPLWCRRCADDGSLGWVELPAPRPLMQETPLKTKENVKLKLLDNPIAILSYLHSVFSISKHYQIVLDQIVAESYIGRLIYYRSKLILGCCTVVQSKRITGLKSRLTVI